MAISETLEQQIITTIRTLSIDAIQKANSGHPGAPMGLAPLAFTVYNEFVKHNPKNPNWPNRDRFVVSNGHASMLLYSILHIMGYDLSLDDIKQFRQLHSKCPGHPEYGEAPGVEVTTGPLGQGVSVSVGMAIAQKWLAARFNKPDFNLLDYHIFALCGDGDLMEGVASEAASLAGHLKLNNLIWFYDNNHITIEGNTELAGIRVRTVLGAERSGRSRGRRLLHRGSAPVPHKFCVFSNCQRVLSVTSKNGCAYNPSGWSARSCKT